MSFIYLLDNVCDCRTSLEMMTLNWIGFSRRHWPMILLMWASVVCC